MKAFWVVSWKWVFLLCYWKIVVNMFFYDGLSLVCRTIKLWMWLFIILKIHLNIKTTLKFVKYKLNKEVKFYRILTLISQVNVSNRINEFYKLRCMYVTFPWRELLLKESWTVSIRKENSISFAAYNIKCNYWP